MKKYFIFLLIMFMFLPNLVLAKGEPPVYINYKVKVTNKDGITLKTGTTSEDKNIKIPYDTVLEITYEYEENGKLYGNVEYDNNIGMIEISDVELLDKEINLDKYKTEVENKIYVFDKGVYLYNGPSKAYGIVNNTEIPVGTVLTYTYGDEAWAYVTYNGLKGWIYVYTYDNVIYEKGAHVAISYDNKKIYTLKNIELIDSPLTNNKKNITIPELVTATYKYVYSPEPLTLYYYIKYEDKEGWYKYKPLEIAELNDEDFIVNAYEDGDIYEKPSLDSKVLGSIKKDEEYNLIAISLNDNIDDNSYESWTYIKYKDIKGWLHYIEKGKEVTDKKDIEKQNVKSEENQKSKDNNSWIKIVSFSIAAIIIVLFIMYTILKFIKKEK